MAVTEGVNLPTHRPSAPVVRRRVPLKRLAVDRDPLFRPCPELQSAAADWSTLDRPLVPLLNEFWRLGLATRTSCAGHLRHAGLPYVSLGSASARTLVALRTLAAYVPDWHLWVNLVFEEGTAETDTSLHWMWPPEVRWPTRAWLAESDVRVLAMVGALQHRQGDLPENGLASWEGDFISSLASIRDLSVADLPFGSRARPLRKDDRENLLAHFNVTIAPDGPEMRFGIWAGVFAKQAVPGGTETTPLWSWLVSGTCSGCVTEQVRRALLPRGCEPTQPAPHVAGCDANAIHA